METRAPALERAVAVARPMPLEPPVIMATRPDRGAGMVGSLEWWKILFMMSERV